MESFTSGDGSLQFRVRGSGDPLIMISGGIIADGYEGIADALAARYQLLTFRRRGFGGSSAAREPDTISAQAADAVALLDHLGVATAHVGGHSYGGAVALQMALDAPTRVHSLALLEPGLVSAPSGEEFGAAAARIAERYQSGDADGALVAFLTLVGGDDPVARISKTLPAGWYEQALADLSTLFGADLVSLGGWQFTEQDARTIGKPALTVKGTQTFPMCAESYELLRSWLPNAESFVLDGATHLLQIDDPDGMARGLLDFLARHPISG